MFGASKNSRSADMIVPEETTSIPALIMSVSLRMLPLPIGANEMTAEAKANLVCVARSVSDESCLNMLTFHHNRLPDGTARRRSETPEVNHYPYFHSCGTKDDAFLGAKNVRTMLSIFKRRASDASTQLPSAELVEKWAENFSNLLNDKYGLMLFRSFLCSEYSEENIEFWIACEEYKHLKAKQLAQKAQKIYSDFVTVHAPKEVNLDSKTRLETMKNLSAPDKMTFEQAQSRIQCLMEKDSYPRFLRSQLYLNTLKQAQECSV